MITSYYRQATLTVGLVLASLSAQSADLLVNLASEASIPHDIRLAVQRTVSRLLAPPEGNIEDVELNNYLNRLLDKIEPSSNYYIGLANDKKINAFATVGGVIMVNSGLWLSADTEEELAGVIAHEAAHQKLKHLERGAEKASKETLLSITAAAAALLIGDSRLQDAIILSSPAALASSQLSHSREFEVEADAIGFDLLLKARIQPEGLVRFLSKIQELEAGGAVPEYLRSHPVSTNRIAALTSRIENRPSGAKRSDGLDFLLLKQKLSILMKLEEDVVQKKLHKIGQASIVSFPKEKVVDLYGLLLASAQGKNWEAFKKAERIIGASGIKHPLIYGSLIGGMKDNGRTEEALQLAQEALEAFPSEYPLAALHSEMLAAIPNESNLNLIRRHQKTFGQRLELVRAEAELLSGIDQEALSHLRLADASLAMGDVQRAGQQIRIAKSAILMKDSSATRREETLMANRSEEKYFRYREKFAEIFAQ